MKLSMHTMIFLLALASCCHGVAALAQNGAPPPPPSDEQKACLDKQLGKPGSGELPSREKMEAAFKSCDIPPPPAEPPPKVYDADQNAD